MLKKNIVLGIGIFIQLAISASFLGCDSGGASVGSGGGFDTFTTQPTGAEFSSALLTAVETRAPLAKIAATELLQKWFLRNSFEQKRGLTSNSTRSSSGSRDCFSGGTVSWTTTSETTANSANAKEEVSLSACAVSPTLSGKSYAETLTGSLTVNVAGTASDFNISYKVSISGSGDIGFAVDCNLEATLQNPNINTKTGSCVFKDAKGNTITSEASELGGFLF